MVGTFIVLLPPSDFTAVAETFCAEFSTSVPLEKNSSSNHGTENLCMTLDQAGSTEIYHLPRDEVLSGSQPNLRLLFCAVHTKMNIWSCFFVGANVVQISFHVIFLV